ncbi:extracellular solute-binding protein family 1 [Allomeiothermus silvanus DSM 9946]|uniref:Extracellular solute-binding protein family 1 n=1 Tax=Allomeiothermus silvanus (strain ATCC 700542 / DSM 9946 / NBRC 106475 / NCIMB 13440 / VI-R2) TaxID=526227 RepID=D7BFA3_ALLS1|nr:spermidine/putrescine ABC transporter substrate-binding protein [Allomeiothermus silvanus]ADH63456.1 extracellular solute-binding protein family 1 [Allomeiothermus silvanus DSM 9946]
MKKFATVVALVFLLPLLTACPKQQTRDELRIYNWSDYMPEEVIQDFEKRENAKIVLDTYDDPEAMVSKLQAGGDSEYDVVILSDYLVGQLAQRGTILELDKSKIPNFKNLDPSFADPAYDPGSKHSVVYQWGTTGLAYREDLVKGPVDSWAVLFDPAKSVGSFLLLTEMREQVGAALRYLGASVNSTDPATLERAKRLLIDAKRRSQGFAGGTDAVQQVLSGNVAVAVAYSGDAFRAMEENPKVKYVIPREGGTIWSDVLTILSKSKNSELAYKFINYLLEPEVAAKVSNGIGYGTPVPAALPMIEARDNPIIYPSAEVRKKLEFLGDLGPAADLYNKIWAEVRAQ